MMREILTQRGFTEEEITTLESREDFEALRLRVERLQADSLLDQLEARTEERIETQAQSLEERWERFKTTISELEGGSENTETSIQETVEEMRTRLESEAIERAETAIRERLSRVPLFGEGIADWLINSSREYIENNDTSTGGKIKNWFFMLIAGFCGARGIVDTLRDEVSQAGEAELEGAVEASSIPERESEEPETGIENLNLSNFRYNSGLNTLIFFSDGTNIENDTNVRNRIFDTIRDLPLEQVSSLDGDAERQVTIFGDQLDSPGFREGLDILLPTFKNSSFLEVCELSLGGDNIELILNPNGVENHSLFELLGPQRAREIVRLSKVPGFELSTLTMHELSILYSASFPSFAYLQVANTIELGVSVIDTTSTEFQEIAAGSISGKVFAYIGRNGDGTSLLDDDARFIEGMLRENPDMDRATVERIIEFKDYIRSNDFQSNPLLRLSGETLDAFNANLNYTRVAILYDVLKGGNIETITPLNFPLLILSISSIISGNTGENIDNRGLAESYRGEFMRNGAIDFFGRDNISDSEQRAFEIYGGAFINAGLLHYIEQVYGATQFVEGFTGISDEVLFTGSTGLALAGRQLSRQGLLRASPGALRIGGTLSRVGWWGMIIYGGILGYEYLTGDEGQEETPDLDNGSGGYIGQAIDRDLQEAETFSEQQEVLSRLQSNTREHTIGGETMTIITYPGEIPHAVYRGQVWILEVVDGDSVASSIEDHIINSFRGFTEDSELTNDSVWTDGEYVYVGSNAQNSFRYSFDELFTNNNMAMGINTAQSIGASMEDLFPGSNFGGQELGQYITLISIPGEDNKYLSLIAAPMGGQSTPTS